MINLSCKKLQLLVTEILSNFGVPPTVGQKVANSLILNEIQDYPSHGIARLLQYIEEIKKGLINVSQQPRLTRVSNNIGHIEADASFGILTSDLIINVSKEFAKNNAISAVSVANSHHIGRLSKIGLELSQKPHNLFVIGFCNYLGGGARVAPPGGKCGPRLCTNPILLSFPADENGPFVLDISTSVTSEGSIGIAKTKSEKIRSGILVHKSETLILDPNMLYEDPENVTIAPLGSPLAGHKGYAMAVFVEAIVGLLGGANFICKPKGNGNGLFIITINPKFFNASQDIAGMGSDLLKACYQVDENQDFRYPGMNAFAKTNYKDNDIIGIHGELYKKIQIIHEQSLLNRKATKANERIITA